MDYYGDPFRKAEWRGTFMKHSASSLSYHNVR